jgi:hypothetical protein
MSQSPPIKPFVGQGHHGTLTADDARILLAEFAKSDMTEAEFAHCKGLHRKTLPRWRTRLAKAGAIVPRPVRVPELVPVRVRRELAPTPTPTPAMPTHAAPETHFELLLERGRVLRIPQRFESDALLRLLTALEPAS